MAISVPAPQRPGSSPGPNDLLGSSIQNIFSSGFVTNNYGSRLAASLTEQPGAITPSILLGIDQAASYADTAENQEPTALIQTVVYSDKKNNGIQFDQEMAMFFKKLDKTERELEQRIDKTLSDFTRVPSGLAVSPRRVYSLPQLNHASLKWQFEQLAMGVDLTAAKVFNNLDFFFAGWCNTMHKTSGYGNPNYLAATTDYNSGQGQNLPSDYYMTDRVMHGFVTAKNVFGNCVYTGAGLFYILREFQVTKEIVEKYYSADSMRPNYGMYIASERHRYATQPYDPSRPPADPNWRRPQYVYIMMPYANACDTCILDKTLLQNHRGKHDAVVLKIGNVRHGKVDNATPHLRTYDENNNLVTDAILRRSLDYNTHASAEQRIEININISSPVVYQA